MCETLDFFRLGELWEDRCDKVERLLFRLSWLSSRFSISSILLITELSFSITSDVEGCFRLDLEPGAASLLSAPAAVFPIPGCWVAVFLCSGLGCVLFPCPHWLYPCTRNSHQWFVTLLAFNASYSSPVLYPFVEMSEGLLYVSNEQISDARSRRSAYLVSHNLVISFAFPSFCCVRIKVFELHINFIKLNFTLLSSH